MHRHAGAEIEGDAVEMIARPGRTIRAALFQAIDMRIAKVPAARALREIAADRREMTDLRRRETKRCRRNTRIGLRDASVGRDLGDRRQRADPRCAVGAPHDPGDIRCFRDIDQRSLRNTAAPAFGEISAGGAEFRWPRESSHCCGCHAAALPFNAATRRSGRIGISVSLTPIALQMALAIAGDVGTVATSPMPTLPPSTWSKPPSSKCTSIGGVSAMPGMR